MGRSGLGKHRSSPLRSGRVVQSSSKGGNLPQVGWLSVIAIDGWPPQPVLSPVLPFPVIAPVRLCVCSKRKTAWTIPKPQIQTMKSCPVHLLSGSLLSAIQHHWLSLSRSVAPGFHSACTCITTAWLPSLTRLTINTSHWSCLSVCSLLFFFLFLSFWFCPFLSFLLPLPSSLSSCRH